MALHDPSIDHPDDGEEVGQLTELVLTTDTFEAFLTELAHYASAQTEHTCSVTVRTGNRPPYTVVSTDDLSLRLDEQQYHDGRGPCLEALATGVPVVVTDMAAESRWQPYPARAAELGARSSISQPLISGEQVIGVLNMYAFKKITPDVGMLARVAQLGDRAAGALAVGMRIAEQSTENANLRTALTSRSVIDQAIGILMAQQLCTEQEALALLRQASQSRNVKLRDVAAQIVGSVQRRKPGQSVGRTER
ncbi:MAG TPA: GAF and ANTAR domain-containing protein [Jatrophihabitans sp.]|nr:GAF and ANTAR domain-containing protein [Jatrophihabitans sp.]